MAVQGESEESGGNLGMYRPDPLVRNAEDGNNPGEFETVLIRPLLSLLEPHPRIPQLGPQPEPRRFTQDEPVVNHLRIPTGQVVWTQVLAQARLETNPQVNTHATTQVYPQEISQGETQATPRVKTQGEHLV